MSHSVGTVLYENESRFVHLITSQYECVMNCLWTAVFEGNRTFGFVSYLAAWESNFRGLSHLKWKNFSGEDPRIPRPHPSTTPKEGGWYATGLQRTAARLITGTRVYEHLPRQLLLAWAGLDRLDDRRYVKCRIIGFKLIYWKERLPGHLTAYAEVWRGPVPERTSSMNSRSQSNSTALPLPRPQTEILKSSPFYHCFTILNSIPIENLSSLAYLSTYLENSRQTSII